MKLNYLVQVISCFLVSVFSSVDIDKKSHSDVLGEPSGLMSTNALFCGIWNLSLKNYKIIYPAVGNVINADILLCSYVSSLCPVF